MILLKKVFSKTLNKSVLLSYAEVVFPYEKMEIRAEYLHETDGLISQYFSTLEECKTKLDIEWNDSEEVDRVVNEERGLIVTTIGDGLDYSYSICNLRGEEITNGTFGFSEGYCTNAKIIAMQDKGLRPDMLLRK